MRRSTTRRATTASAQLLGLVIRRKWLVAGSVVGAFVVAVLGMGLVKKQFFPTSDRPEVLVEVQMAYGTSIEQTSATTAKVEAWLAKQPEAKTVTAYVGQGAPRFYLAMSPELPDPSFAKIVVLTESEEAREALKLSLRQAVADGLAPEARVRVTQLVFGPYSPFPVAFRVMGPDPDKLRDIAAQALAVMQASALMRTVNSDWGERVPALRFSLDQDRLQSIGLTSSDVGQQLQFLLSGVPITDVREDIRSVQVIARSAGDARLDPSKIADFTLVGTAGQRIPLSQIGTVEIRMEDPVLRRRDRTPTITVRGDIAEGLQPPDVSTAVWKELQPIIAQLPAGYRIEQGGSIEESGKANRALAPLLPIMIALTLITIIFQVRSISVMTMVFATAPLGPHRGHSDLAVIPAAVWHQRAGRPDRAFRNPDAQHAHPDRPDPPEREGWIGAIRGRGRGHRAALPPRHSDGARRHAGIHSAHPVGFLGNAGIHLDRGNLRRDGSHARVLASVVCHLVQDQIGGKGPATRFCDWNDECPR